VNVPAPVLAPEKPVLALYLVGPSPRPQPLFGVTPRPRRARTQLAPEASAYQPTDPNGNERTEPEAPNRNRCEGRRDVKATRSAKPNVAAAAPRLKASRGQNRGSGRRRI